MVALVALSFGIGANSAIFSVVNGVLLRPLPYKDSGRLVVVSETKISTATKQELVSPANYREWAEQNSVFDQIAALRVEPRVLTGGELPERVEIALLSPGAFEMLGVQPALGRTFSQDESQPGTKPGGCSELRLMAAPFWRRTIRAREDGRPGWNQFYDRRSHARRISSSRYTL